MSNPPKLPAPRKGAGTIVDICAAITADIAAVLGVPSNTILEAIKKLVQKRLEAAQEILIAELKGGNVSLLSEADLEEFIPTAYRFFRAAQEGEHVHNLKILAQIIKGESENGAIIKSEKFLVVSDALSGLSVADLRACYQLSRAPVMWKGEKKVANFEEYKSKLVPVVFETPGQLRGSLAKLCGRGLAFQFNAAPDSEFDYFPSPLLESLVNIAKFDVRVE